MSDLLPLVAAVLRDKAAADVQDELTGLKEEVAALRSVEVLRSTGETDRGGDDDEDGDVVVYASGDFSEGKYSSNPNLWEVRLGPTRDRCPLSALRRCQLCVGGGFPAATLNDQGPAFQGWLTTNIADDGDENSVGINICVSPYATWLNLTIHGWPNEEWEAKIQADDIDPDGIVDYLVDTVALRHPDAFVEFMDACFIVRHIHGALKRILPPRRIAEARAERDGQDTEENRVWSDLYEFVMRTMRQLGNDAGAELFGRQVQRIMGALEELGITDRRGDGSDQEQIISRVIRIHHEHGEEGLLVEQMISRLRGEMTGDDSNNQT